MFAVHQQDLTIDSRVKHSADQVLPLHAHRRNSQPGSSSASACHRELNEEDCIQVVPHVLARKKRLESFWNTLNYLLNIVRASGTGQDLPIKRIINNLQLESQILIVGEKIEINEETQLKQIEKGLLGFPLKSEVLEITPQQMEAWTEKEIQNWVSEAERVNKILKSYIDNGSIWRSLAPNAPKNFAFIPLEDLP